MLCFILPSPGWRVVTHALPFFEEPRCFLETFYHSHAMTNNFFPFLTVFLPRAYCLCNERCYSYHLPSGKASLGPRRLRPSCYQLIELGVLWCFCIIITFSRTVQVDCFISIYLLEDTIMCINRILNHYLI